jgi:hypothetical protein
MIAWVGKRVDCKVAPEGVHGYVYRKISEFKVIVLLLLLTNAYWSSPQGFAHGNYQSVSHSGMEDSVVLGNYAAAIFVNAVLSWQINPNQNHPGHIWNEPQHIEGNSVSSYRSQMRTGKYKDTSFWEKLNLLEIIQFEDRRPRLTDFIGMPRECVHDRNWQNVYKEASPITNRVDVLSWTRFENKSMFSKDTYMVILSWNTRLTKSRIREAPTRGPQDTPKRVVNIILRNSVEPSGVSMIEDTMIEVKAKIATTFITQQ